MRFRLVQLIWLLLGLVVLVHINPVLAVASSNLGGLLLLREMMDNSTPQNRAVVSCGGKDNFQQARSALMWAVTIQPERVSTYAMLGRLEIASGCLHAGQVWLEQGYQQKSTDTIIGLMLGDVYESLGETDAAVRIWRSSPAILEGYIQGGGGAAYGHDWEWAEIAFRRAVAIDPYSAAARWGLGEVFYGQGRYDEAVKTFTVARTLGTPPDAYKIVEFAHVLDMRGRGAEAVRMLDESNVTGALADAIRGNYHLQTGQLDQAVRFLENSVLLQPEDVWFRKALAEAYARQEQKELAVAQLEAALRINPDFQPGRDLLGCLSVAIDLTECLGQ